MKRKLTAKQIKFADGLISGKSQAQAYRDAYDCKNMANETVINKAYVMANRGDIRAVVDAARKKAEDAAIWSRVRSLKELVGVVDTAKEYFEKYSVNVKDMGPIMIDGFNGSAANAAVKAIEQLNKMCGYNEPDKMVISGLREYLDDCRGEKF